GPRRLHPAGAMTITPDMKALGVGATVVIGGAEYELPPMTAAEHARYSRWLILRAWQHLEEVRAELGEAWYAYQSRLLQERVDAGDFDYMRPAFARSLGSRDGLRQAFWISLQRNHRG